MGLDENSKIVIGKLRKGKMNLITDVSGVKVGHVTLNEDGVKTGVTAILPHDGNIFKEKVMSASYVLNGFGKSMGLIQIDELGTIETPIIMTNTLSIGVAATALIKYMLNQNDDIGTKTGTVNCVITECNDGSLNDIRGLHVKEEHIIQAIINSSKNFEEGCVGSGTGMTCLGVKGGIGSASRVIVLDNKEYIIGAIVMSNFGMNGDLMISGENVGEKICKIEKDKYKDEKDKDEKDKDEKDKDEKDKDEKDKDEKDKDEKDKDEKDKDEKDKDEKDKDEKDIGSIIIVIATDIPLNERQLKRIAKRSAISLGRTGSIMGNGSGDICIAFSTANKINHYSEMDIIDTKLVYEDNLDIVFRGAIESVEESIISSLYHAETTVGYNGKVSKCLREYM